MWAQSQTWHGRAKVTNTTANLAPTELEWAGPTNAMVQDIKLWDLECLLSYRHSSTITFWQALIRSLVFSLREFTLTIWEDVPCGFVQKTLNFNEFSSFFLMKTTIFCSRSTHS
jgi:hypothetical protein